MSAYPVGSKLGPLSGLGGRFAVALEAKGYSACSSEAVLAVWWDLNRWLTAEGLLVGEWTGERVVEFGEVRRAAGRRRYVKARSFAPLVEFFVAEGLVSLLPAPGPVTALDELIESYRWWLVNERALAPRTVHRYVLTAGRFLSARRDEAGSGSGVEGLCGADVSGFVLEVCRRVSAASAKVHVGELRSLLRFLYLDGRIDGSLAESVPGVAVWHNTVLPPTLEPGQVQALLDSCDRGTVTGRRDFAMLTVLARLGLRSAEIAGLDLDDLDWRAGEIVVRGKGSRIDRLPMPTDVGEALVAYIRDGRPAVVSRKVFIRRKAPLSAIGTTGVSNVVRSACRRAGVLPMGPHRLRHGLAAELVAAGAALPEVAQLLRHRDLASTAIYAKVDRVALSSLAQPWPTVAS